MAKKKSTRVPTPKLSDNELNRLSLQIAECVSALQVASDDAEIISHDNQQRLINVVSVVKRDLERIQVRIEKHEELTS